MAEVIGTNTAGVGVSGTGSTYGVYGTSTGTAAGVVGTNGQNGTGPGVYAQSVTPAPGLFAICALAVAYDEFFGTDLDAAAASWGAQFPNSAAIFIGPAVVTGGLSVGPTPVSNPPAGSLTAETGAFSSGLTAQNGAAFPAVAVSGSSPNGHGVQGTNQSGANVTPQFGCGVLGESNQGYGVFGASISAAGVYGTSEKAHGMRGTNQSGANVTPKYGCGVLGESDQGYGVFGASVSASGVYGTSKSGLAGEFEGNVSVKGQLTAADVLLSGADCAEEFDVVVDLEPGTVAVFDDDCRLAPCAAAYDKRVAGVVSGAGAYRAGIVLDRRANEGPRAAIALVGKVFCKVDASYAAIEAGDLLTTSPTSGCAMKAADAAHAFGAVIGKALRPLPGGTGLIPMLVSLR